MSHAARPTIDFSAVVVTYNEADLLPAAIGSIRFCRELIVVDLGSTDATLDVARAHGARILTHERPAYPNLPRQHGIRHATHPWIVTIDPDEQFPAHELSKIEAVIHERPDLSGVRLPWQFYFAGRRLTTTFWGRPNCRKMTVVHRDRIRTTPYVHQEYVLDEHVFSFRPGQIDAVRHDWMRNWADLFEKHRRYLEHEGERRFARGERFAWRRAPLQWAGVVWADLFTYRGVTGWTGLQLSAFHAWYEARGLLSLRRFQRARETDRR